MRRSDRLALAPLAAGLTALALLAGCSSTSSGPTSTAGRTGDAMTGPPTTSGPARPSSSAAPSDGTGSPGPPSSTMHPTRATATTAPWHLPAALAREAAVRRGAIVVLAGGLLPGDASTDRVLSVRLPSGATLADPPLAVPVHDTAGVRIGHRLLVVGGGNAAEQAVVQAGDSGGSRWSTVGRMPQARSDLSVVRVGRRILVLGGYDGTSTAIGSILATTDGSTFGSIGRLALPVRYAATAVDRGSVLVFGGERAGVMQRAVQRVDRHGRTSVVAQLPVALGHASAVLFGDRILVMGGRLDATRVTDRMWWFDPVTGRFRAAGHLPTPLADSAVVRVGSSAYLFGGETPAATDAVTIVRAS